MQQCSVHCSLRVLTANAALRHAEKMKKLVAEGADINEGNNRGWTALMYACRYRHEEVCLGPVTLCLICVCALVCPHISLSPNLTIAMLDALPGLA